MKDFLKVKILLGIILLIIGFLLIISAYVCQNTNWNAISNTIFIGIILSLIFLIFFKEPIERTFIKRWVDLIENLFKFYVLNLKNDISMSEIIFGQINLKLIRSFHLLYLVIMTFFIVGFVAIIYKQNININQLIIPLLSLILASAGLSTLSFNYSKGLDDEFDKKLMFLSAKRFFMVTFLAIISFSLLIVIMSLNPVTINFDIPIEPNLINFVLIYFKTGITLLFLMVDVILVANAIKFFVEGLILSFKVSLKF